MRFRHQGDNETIVSHACIEQNFALLWAPVFLLLKYLPHRGCSVLIPPDSLQHRILHFLYPTLSWLLSRSGHIPGLSPLLWPCLSISAIGSFFLLLVPPASVTLRVLQVQSTAPFSGSLSGWSHELLWFTCHLHAMSHKSISSSSPLFELQTHIPKWQLNMTSFLPVLKAHLMKYL